MTFQNNNPGEWTFDLSGNLGSATITTEITGEDPSEFVRQINLSSGTTGITAAINADGITINLTDSANGSIEIKNLAVFGINSAQKEPTSFFTVQPKDGAGNSLGNIQKLFDNNLVYLKIL